MYSCLVVEMVSYYTVTPLISNSDLEDLYMTDPFCCEDAARCIATHYTCSSDKSVMQVSTIGICPVHLCTRMEIPCT